MLELGCGAGFAIAAACELLEDIAVAAVDRSETQVALARRRNAAHVAAGRASVVAAAAHELPFEDGVFDTVFAIRLNVFWTSDAGAELAEIERVLRPGGALRLFYDAPAAGKAELIAARVADALGRRERLRDVVVVRESVLCVSAVRR